MPKGIPKAGKRNVPNKKEDIHKAAMRVFCHYGIFGATVEKIANEAAVSPALVLNYYKNKFEIAELCVRSFLEDFSERLLKLARKEGITYRQNVENVFELFKTSRREWQFIIGILVTPALGDMGREITTHYMAKAHEVVSIFEREIQDGKSFELAYAMNAMYFSYIIGGSEQNFRRARNELLRRYLVSYTE